MDYLSTVRTAVGCAGRTTLITPGGPADRRRTEQQYQHAKRDDSHRDPDRRLMRTHNQIPRHRQQQQLGEHRQPATPKLANRQPASGGEHCSADQYEPTAVPRPLTMCWSAPASPRTSNAAATTRAAPPCTATISPAPRTAAGARTGTASA
ncbi:hypothetical protein MT3313 [Mycobacterium tuberculosis CDC1551]|uniref:Uncharacterized protein n=1 Tax=Mycobacterium tuberculosis (strain CDC 1551 / Oshkosh) TaxID=83331 RepID=Q8VJ47_MYCTO|nr:hypothetical protein MT3313 [Mycobacterium tuberculosis CDC1551]